VYGRVSEVDRQHREIWKPARLLKRLAESGEKFAEFERAAASATDELTV
jgi:hypothetical protein